jgi:hypothetical protein
MTPSVETRLRAIAGALEHLIIPALAEANADPIVQEQASLSLGHLQIIAMQLPERDAYHDICLREQLRTGAELLACATGGDATTSAASALYEAMAEAKAHMADRSRAKEGRNRVAGAIAQLVIASSMDGDADYIGASQTACASRGATAPGTSRPGSIPSRPICRRSRNSWPKSGALWSSRRHGSEARPLPGPSG